MPDRPRFGLCPDRSVEWPVALLAIDANTVLDQSIRLATDFKRKRVRCSKSCFPNLAECFDRQCIVPVSGNHTSTNGRPGWLECHYIRGRLGAAGIRGDRIDVFFLYRGWHRESRHPG